MHTSYLVRMAAVALCAGLAVFATTQPWLAGHAWSERGFDLWQGNLPSRRRRLPSGAAHTGCPTQTPDGSGPPSALGLVIIAMSPAVLATETGLRDDRSVADGLFTVAPRFGLFLALAAGLGCAVLPWSLARRPS